MFETEAPYVKEVSPLLLEHVLQRLELLLSFALEFHPNSMWSLP